MNAYDLEWGDPRVSPADRWSWIRSGTTALQRVMAKPGVRPVRETVVPATGLSIRVHSISRPQATAGPAHPTYMHARRGRLEARPLPVSHVRVTPLDRPLEGRGYAKRIAGVRVPPLPCLPKSPAHDLPTRESPLIPIFLFLRYVRDRSACRFVQ